MRVAGIDIGGTKSALGVFDGTTLVERHSVPTMGFEDTVEAMVDWLRSFAVESVGVGCAGPLDEEAGTVRNVSTLTSWFGLPLTTRISEGLGAPVKMVNDADAALLGELWQGALSDCQTEPALMLTIGTGVGGAFWDGKHRLIGAGSNHPEIGHIHVVNGGERCACGQMGCLEIEVSGSALNVAAARAGFKDFASMVEAGAAEPAFAHARRCLSTAIFSYAHVLLPSRIVLGGGVVDRTGEALFPFTALSPEQAPMLAEPIPILRAQLGNQAGIYGAAALALGYFS